MSNSKKLNAHLPGRWEGHSEGEYWFVEVEADRFADTEPFVVSLLVKYDEDPRDVEVPIQDSLAMLSPGQAREMATNLLHTADYVERRNADLLLEDTSRQERRRDGAHGAANR